MSSLITEVQAVILYVIVICLYIYKHIKSFRVSRFIECVIKFSILLHRLGSVFIVAKQLIIIISIDESCIK